MSTFINAQESTVVHRNGLLLANTTINALGGSVVIGGHPVSASLRDVMSWTSCFPYEKAHEAARAGRTPNTGQWLLERGPFREWRESSASTFLWLHGIPGAGKSKLASKVVDHLLESRRTAEGDEGLAYFYCDRNQRDRQDPLTILRSFVLQLSTGGDGKSVRPCLVSLYDEKKGRGPANPDISQADCVRLLHELTHSYPQTTLVLDALDEADRDKRADLIDILDELVASAGKPVKVFISSRRDLDIKRQYGDGRNVAIEATDNAGDISAFVAEQLSMYEKRRRRSLTPALRREIIEVLQDKSNGMFQWAALQVRQLLKLERASDMRTRLGKLPASLQAAYDEIYALIQQQEGSSGKVADRAIKWVMSSYGSLSQQQMLGAVCQNPDDDDEPSPVDIDSADFVLGACHNLLEFDRSEGTWRFSHLSVQEYFEDLHRVRGLQEWSYCSMHAMAAKVCLLLLNDPSLYERDARCSPPSIIGRQPPCASSEIIGSIGIGSASGYDKTVPHDYHKGPSLEPLLRYARCNWAFNVQKHGLEAIDPRVSASLQRFLGTVDESSHSYRAWRRALAAYGGQFSDDTTSLQSLLCPTILLLGPPTLLFGPASVALLTTYGVVYKFACGRYK